MKDEINQTDKNKYASHVRLTYSCTEQEKLLSDYIMLNAERTFSYLCRIKLDSLAREP